MFLLLIAVDEEKEQRTRSSNSGSGVVPACPLSNIVAKSFFFFYPFARTYRAVGCKSVLLHSKQRARQVVICCVEKEENATGTPCKNAPSSPVGLFRMYVFGL